MQYRRKLNNWKKNHQYPVWERLWELAAKYPYLPFNYGAGRGSIDSLFAGNVAIETREMLLSPSFTAGNSRLSNNYNRQSTIVFLPREQKRLPDLVCSSQ
jgi:hypothetical protein